jgi:hypothetical protein
MRKPKKYIPLYKLRLLEEAAPAFLAFLSNKQFYFAFKILVQVCKYSPLPQFPRRLWWALSNNRAKNKD